ncbi:MAG: acyltransferase, partial [Dehalococcoidia bacterium]|nr:acyltransferase [Dehalococcoidia bacterium]
MSMLVVAPITAEFEALAGAFGERWGSPVLREAGRVAVREYEAAGVILAEGGFGKVQYGVTTQHLLDHLPDVDLVVCAGVAGALADSVGVGDVVVATATVEHDFYSEVLRRVPPRIDG